MIDKLKKFEDKYSKKAEEELIKLKAIDNPSGWASFNYAYALGCSAGLETAIELVEKKTSFIKELKQLEEKYGVYLSSDYTQDVDYDYDDETVLGYPDTFVVVVDKKTYKTLHSFRETNEIKED